MDAKAAIRKASLILAEERRQPTTGYMQTGQGWLEQATLLVQGKYDEATRFGNARKTSIIDMRKQSPRGVCEDPDAYEFQSANFDLLNALFYQLHESHRDEFIAGLLHPVEQGGNTVAYPQPFFPKFDGVISDLPLIAEFTIRNGYAEQLFAALGRAKQPTKGLALMMSQLEEMIALNFNIFSEAEYNLFPAWFGGIRHVADLQTHKARGDRGGKMVENPHYKPGRERIGEQIVKSVDNLFGEMRQAEYYYLKGALLQIPNLEIDNDRVKIHSFIDTLGFDPLLSAALKKADDIYNGSPDAFDLKSCIGHIRSFIEHLHIQAGMAIAKSVNKTVLDVWDPVMTFLKNDGFLTIQQDKFARGLYMLLSDEGVHPLIAEREFARLLRNMSIEYGLMFLTMFEKKGIKIQATRAQVTTGTPP
jgi:hypothetical protein